MSRLVLYSETGNFNFNTTLQKWSPFSKQPDDKKREEDKHISTSYVKLISICKQNVSRPVTLKELKFSSLPYSKHLINQRSICTHDLDQDSPIQTSC